MRHTVHIMFGEALREASLKLGQYYALYSSDMCKPYFTAMHYEEDKSHKVAIHKVTKKQEEALTFSVGLYSQWIPEFEEIFSCTEKDRAEQLLAFAWNLRNDRINFSYRGHDNLHLVLYFPLYDETIWTQVCNFVDFIHQDSKLQVDIDLMGLACDTAEVFQPEHKNTFAQNSKKLQAQTKATIDAVLKKRSVDATKWVSHFIVLKNQTNQRALNLTIDSFAASVGEFAMLCTESYETLFGRNTDYRDIHGLGLSMLSFDQYYFKEFILQDSFVRILNDEQINDSEVSITWAAREIDKLLTPWMSIMSDFYKLEVDTKLEQGEEIQNILPNVQALLSNKFKEINDAIVDRIMHDPELSLPQKKGLLSILLGEDDELFLHGTLINSEQKILIDLERECLEFFIKENNRLLLKEETKESAILPPFNPEEDENGKVDLCAKLPIDEIKKLRYQERNYIANIREVQDEIDDIKQRLTDIVESKKCLIEGGKIFINNDSFILIHHDDDVVPLKEDYQPHFVKEKTVDISSGFTAIKNQGQMGACMSFSMVSVFEYFLKQNREQFPDLSEQFLYFNARKRVGKENEDGGSSSVNSIHALSEDGICSEEACPYTIGNYAVEPSKEAYQEAQLRRVKNAVMVKKDIEHIKSALSDGLPVVFGAEVFPSFGSCEKGFVMMPAEDEIAATRATGENNGHAMVFCGFDDEQQLFKVRNSWGTSFGDEGYCYMPYEYVKQYAYWDMVAITEIEVHSSDELEHQEESIEIVNQTFTIKSSERPQLHFSENDLQVRMALRRNFRSRLEKELGELQKQDTALQVYYESLKMPLRDRNKRDVFQQAVLANFTKNIEDLEEHKLEIEKEKTKQVAAYKRATILKAISVGSSLFGTSGTFGVLYGIFANIKNSAFVSGFLAVVREILYFTGHDTIAKALRPDDMQNYFLWISIVMGIITILYLVLFIWIRIERRKRLEDKFDQQMRQANVEITDLKAERDTYETRVLLAGEMISNLMGMTSYFQTRKAAMSHFTLNLKEWYKQTEAAHKAMHLDENTPFVSLLQNNKLDTFFGEKQQDIVSNAKIWKFIEGYQPSETGIISIQQSIKNDLVEKIEQSYANFSLSDYLLSLKMRPSEYAFLSHDFGDITEFFDDLNRKSDLFLQYSINDYGRDAREVMFVHYDSENEKSRLENALDQVVANIDIQPIDSKYKIVFVKVLGLDADQIII